MSVGLTCGKNTLKFRVNIYVSDRLECQFQLKHNQPSSFIFSHRKYINRYLRSSRVSSSQLQCWVLIASSSLRGIQHSLNMLSFLHMSLLPLRSHDILAPTPYFLFQFCSSTFQAWNIYELGKTLSMSISINLIIRWSINDYFPLWYKKSYF